MRTAVKDFILFHEGLSDFAAASGESQARVSHSKQSSAPLLPQVKCCDAYRSV
jgi:hypothetical protein